MERSLPCSCGPMLPLGPERTGRGLEDRALIEGVERGVRSGGLGEGRLLSESERLVAHFQRLCATALAR